MEKRDYYEVLEVTREADGTTIKKSYRKLAVQYHPDKNPDDPSAEEKFKELGEAYEILMDDQKRAAYDRYGHRAFSQGTGASAGGGFGGGDPFDIFREVFKGGGGGGGGSIFEEFFGGGGAGRSERRKRGSDLRYDLQITLEEVETGVEKELKIERLVECESCDGSGADGGRADVSTCSTCGGVGQVITSRGFFQVQQTCPDCGGGGESISNPCEECEGEGRVDGSSRIKIKIPAGMIDSGRLRSVGHGDAGMKGGSAGDLYVVTHVKKHE
ncbi:MAG: DnaJ domain-containing protein, partial [Verrucomicrobiales bacterium]|nr:DnaJ domain-containing protein [Verrucomicrobiales bacterium]